MMTTEMFNSEVKQKYLMQFENEETKEVYSRLFRKSAEAEYLLNKDLFHFNDKDFEHFLANTLRPKTKESARTYGNVLANYIQWAIDNPKISGAIVLINPLKRRQEFFYEFVDNTSKTYINIHEKEAIISGNMLTNKQDRFMIQGLWEGIQGNKLSELVGLKVTDIDVKNKRIILHNDDGEVIRVIDNVEDRTIQYAILANKETEYQKANGTVDYLDNLKGYAELSKSEYVLKSAKTNSKDNIEGGKKVSHYTVHNRLEMIKCLDSFKEYADALTTKNIVRSGMIYMALKIYIRDKELGRKQIEEICARYNLKYKWSLRDFLNLDTIRSLYPKEMNQIEQEMPLEN